MTTYYSLLKKDDSSDALFSYLGGIPAGRTRDKSQGNDV